MKLAEYALFDGTPRFCPGCGTPVVHARGDGAIEYAAGVAMVCVHCELHYARVESHVLVAAARAAGSDLS